jgi:hypothetical protein
MKTSSSTSVGPGSWKTDGRGRAGEGKDRGGKEDKVEGGDRGGEGEGGAKGSKGNTDGNEYGDEDSGEEEGPAARVTSGSCEHRYASRWSTSRSPRRNFSVRFGRGTGGAPAREARYTCRTVVVSPARKVTRVFGGGPEGSKGTAGRNGDGGLGDGGAVSPGCWLPSPSSTPSFSLP